MNSSKAFFLQLRWQSLAVLGLFFGVPSLTRAFVFEAGDVKGSFDTTISVGGLYRLNNPARDYYSISAGGLQRSSNADDGDLNYKRGMASFLVKASHDLLLHTENAGLFVRGFYFNDFVNSDGTRALVAGPNSEP